MFTHMAVHHPKPEYRDELLASMNRVKVAAAGSAGLLAMHAWREIDGDRVVGFATWDTKDSWQAAAARIFAVVENDPFDLWEASEIEVTYLEAE